MNPGSPLSLPWTTFDRYSPLWTGNTPQELQVWRCSDKQPIFPASDTLILRTKFICSLINPAMMNKYWVLFTLHFSGHVMPDHWMFSFYSLYIPGNKQAPPPPLAHCSDIYLTVHYWPPLMLHFLSFSVRRHWPLLHKTVHPAGGLPGEYSGSQPAD